MAAFPGTDVRLSADGQGGLWVELVDVALGGPYTQESSFVAFLLPFNLPGADVYPIFLRPDLARPDGAALGDGFAATELQWPADPQPRRVMQVSRRTRAGRFTAQTAAQKVVKVLDWVVNR